MKCRSAAGTVDDTSLLPAGGTQYACKLHATHSLTMITDQNKHGCTQHALTSCHAGTPLAASLGNNARTSSTTKATWLIAMKYQQVMQYMHTKRLTIMQLHSLTIMQLHSLIFAQIKTA